MDGALPALILLSLLLLAPPVRAQHPLHATPDIQPATTDVHPASRADVRDTSHTDLDKTSRSDLHKTTSQSDLHETSQRDFHKTSQSPTQIIPKGRVYITPGAHLLSTTQPIPHNNPSQASEEEHSSPNQLRNNRRHHLNMTYVSVGDLDPAGGGGAAAAAGGHQTEHVLHQNAVFTAAAWLSECQSNTSAVWKLTSPVCSTKFTSFLVFLAATLVLGVITLWTIVGNVLVLLALYRYRYLRTMSNCLIGNLAVSDLLLAITVLPISVANDVLGYWVFGGPMCTVWLSIDVLYCTASIWGLCTIAFDRYTATVYPMWYHDQRSTKKALAYMLFVWIFSVVISLAPFIGWQDMISGFYIYEASINRHLCILFSSQSYVLYSALGSFILPSVFMTFLYVQIFVVLHRQADTLAKTNSVTGGGGGPTSPSGGGRLLLPNGCPPTIAISAITDDDDVSCAVTRDMTASSFINEETYVERDEEGQSDKDEEEEGEEEEEEEEEEEADGYDEDRVSFSTAEFLDEMASPDLDFVASPDLDFVASPDVDYVVSPHSSYMALPTQAEFVERVSPDLYYVASENVDFSLSHTPMEFMEEKRSSTEALLDDDSPSKDGVVCSPSTGIEFRFHNDDDDGLGKDYTSQQLSPADAMCRLSPDDVICQQLSPDEVMRTLLPEGVMCQRLSPDDLMCQLSPDDVGSRYRRGQQGRSNSLQVETMRETSFPLHDDGSTSAFLPPSSSSPSSAVSPQSGLYLAVSTSDIPQSTAAFTLSKSSSAACHLGDGSGGGGGGERLGVGGGGGGELGMNSLRSLSVPRSKSASTLYSAGSKHRGVENGDSNHNHNHNHNQNHNQHRASSSLSLHRFSLPWSGGSEGGRGAGGRRSHALTTSMRRRFQMREQRATKRMLLIMACFFVCWVPFTLMYMLRSLCEHCAHLGDHLTAFIIWLGYVNSSLNPLLYTLFNDDFRKAFKKILGIHRPRRRQSRAQ